MRADTVVMPTDGEDPSTTCGLIPVPVSGAY